MSNKACDLISKVAVVETSLIFRICSIGKQADVCFLKKESRCD